MKLKLIGIVFSKIDIFKITSKEDKIYQELLEQYKTNPELQELLGKTIIPSELIMMGDFRIITTMRYAINMEGIKVYLVKDVDDDIFLWVIGKSVEDGEITMYPLLKKQSKNYSWLYERLLLKKG